MAILPNEEHVATAEAVINWAKTKINSTSNSDYVHNLGVMAHKQILNRRDLGLAASAVSAYQKELNLFEERKTKQKEIKPSEFFGTVGERADFVLTLKKQLKIESDWGSFNIYIFQDEIGNTATWKSSVAHPFKKTIESNGSTRQEARELTEGVKYRVKATVKSHEIYKEQKQTILTRLGIVEELAISIESANCEAVSTVLEPA